MSMVQVVFMLLNKFMSEFSNKKLGKSAQDGLGGVHVIEQSAAGDAGLVIDRGGSYKDGQDMKSPSVKIIRHAPITFVESGFCGGS